jgi:hypothetical protein
MVFATLLGLGMVGLLTLTTTLQAQSFELLTLQKEATELSYRQAALEVDVNRARSPQSLAALASALGMRANLHPAYIDLETGKVIGTPKPVSKSDMSSVIVKSPEQLAAEAEQRAAEQRAAEQRSGGQQSEQPRTQSQQPQAPQNQSQQTNEPDEQG